MFCIVKSISISCVNFCDCSNQLKKASANCLIDSKVKLTSFGVEAEEAAAVAVADGFGSSGVNGGTIGSKDPPDVADGLAEDISGLLVFIPVVER